MNRKTNWIFQTTLINYAVYFFLLILTIGCSNSRPSVFRNKADLMRYIEDEKNGLYKKVNCDNDISMKLFSIPSLLLNDFNASSNNFMYLKLCYSKKNKELLPQVDGSEYSALLQTLSFRMTEFIKVKLSQGKTIEPVGVYFQPTYNMATSNDVLIVLDRKDIDASPKLTIVIREFGVGVGKQSFQFFTDDLEYLTAVSIKESN